MNSTNLFPVAIIGAGPIGLAAAAHLNKRNQPFIILESGMEIADSVRSWEHVPMFSPWKLNIDKASRELLARYNWKEPGLNRIPTGKELIEEYLLPLSETKEITPFIRLSSKVISVTRKRISKLRNLGRDSAPFMLRVETDDGVKIVEARAVIDASGTWKTPKPSGADGLPAIGEELLGDKIFYGIPDVLGKEKDRYAGKDVAVIGGGHSAINALLELADLKKENQEMNLTWILTKARVEDAYGGLDNDELPGRGKVGQRVKELVDSNEVDVLTPFFVEEMERKGNKVAIHGDSLGSTNSIMVDEVITATGLKPDISIFRELRINLDQATESPVKLAPLIDPNIHSCGSVRPHGEAELSHPEKDFYIVGMKSYGRAPTFLLATGYEQVRSVVAGLSGDLEAARQVHLELPETGVCGVPAGVDPNSVKANEDAESCCS
ncbi:MAG: glutamate synthase [Balneola sp.]|nr:MAG: glutamate synthase [Balneola sp.]